MLVLFLIRRVLLWIHETSKFIKWNSEEEKKRVLTAWLEKTDGVLVAAETDGLEHFRIGRKESFRHSIDVLVAPLQVGALKVMAKIGRGLITWTNVRLAAERWN